MNSLHRVSVSQVSSHIQVASHPWLMLPSPSRSISKVWESGKNQATLAVATGLENGLLGSCEGPWRCALLRGGRGLGKALQPLAGSLMSGCHLDTNWNHL